MSVWIEELNHHLDLLLLFVQDNGPKGAVRKGQGWDGVCMGRRKSGGILKQHLKLIPVRNAAE